MSADLHLLIDLATLNAANSGLTGTLDLNGLPLLSVLDVTGCTALTNIDVNFCSALTGITGDSTCTGLTDINISNSGVTSLTLGGAANMNRVDLTFCAITSFVAASLQTVATDLLMDGDPLITITLTNLVSVANQIALTSSPYGPTLSFPSLVSVGNPIMDLNANTNMITLSAPNLVTASAGIVCDNSTSLTSLVLNSYLPTPTSDVKFQNCNLDSASIDLILSRCVASVLWGTNSETLDVSLGTNLSHALWSGAALADEATLIGRGAIILSNP